MSDEADGGGLWRINPGGSISLLISKPATFRLYKPKHGFFTIRCAFCSPPALVALDRCASRTASPCLSTWKAARRSLNAGVGQSTGHKPPVRATRAAL